MVILKYGEAKGYNEVKLHVFTKCKEKRVYNLKNYPNQVAVIVE
jgi:hypothetical protein